MASEVLEFHHHGIRIRDNQQSLYENQRFYRDALGLQADAVQQNILGVPGYWFNVGNIGQIYIIAGDGPSKLAKGPGQDPANPHVALAVASIANAKAHLESTDIPYWSAQLSDGLESAQLFINDPCGNMVELPRIGCCRCRAESRCAS